MAAAIPGSVPEQEEAVDCSGGVRAPYFGSQQGHSLKCSKKTNCRNSTLAKLGEDEQSMAAVRSWGGGESSSAGLPCSRAKMGKELMATTVSWLLTQTLLP